MKSFLLALLLVITPVHAWAVDLTKAAKELYGPSLQLNRNCSATAVYSEFDKTTNKVDTIFLTAKHCVDGATDRVHLLYQPVYDKSARLVEERAVRAKVAGTFYKADLALLRAVDTEKVFPNVANVCVPDINIPMGSPVVLVGYPAGFSLTVTEGVFGARESIPWPESSKDTEYFRATPAIAGGNSGGGMFAYTVDGYCLAGVASAGLRNAAHIGYYVPVDQIRDYLKVALASKLN